MFGYFKRLYCFLKESYYEITRKTTWENIDNIKNITFIVLFFTVVLCLVIFGLDYCSKNIVEYLYKIL